MFFRKARRIKALKKDVSRLKRELEDISIVLRITQAQLLTTKDG